MSELQPQQEILTFEQYRSLPDYPRAEVFGGQFRYLPATSRIHRAIRSELTERLCSYASQKQEDCEVIPAPFDVVLTKQPLTIVHPDIMVVCNRHKLSGTLCMGTPDFIMEIVSPANAADVYVRKLHCYYEHGVHEYWIVDPKRRSVSVNYFKGNLFHVPYTFDSIIKVNLFDDLYINFSNIATFLNL